MPAVETWSTQYMVPVPPNTVRPMIEMTDSPVSVGVGRMCSARTVSPMNDTPRIDAIQTSVTAAFLEVGLRKAGMPLEMASTPDRATAPELNARANRKRVMPPSPNGRGLPVSLASSANASSSGGSTGSVSRVIFQMPKPMSAPRAKM